MKDEFGDDIDNNDESNIAEFKPARFSVELGLPDADDSLLNDARTAVRQEFRDCSEWKRLRCRKVDIFTERDRGTVYVVHVGHSVEFDWTWEGAIAFRPMSLDEDESSSNFFHENIAYENENRWSGEVVEVDERNGCLFISLDDPELQPTTGSFFVRPFEFLTTLDAIYNEQKFEKFRQELPSRLKAAEGGVHPAIAQSRLVGLPHLKDWWQHSWSVLWGPPGTGKTYTTGLQVASALHDQRERFLVVSTTNRATDAVAMSIGNAANNISSEVVNKGNLLRIGKGASYQSFKESGLVAMLRGTESEVLSKMDGLAQQLQMFDSLDDKALTRMQMGELRSKGGDKSNRIFIDPDVKVVVSTVFKAMSYLNDSIVKKMIENGDAPFTTVFIDEAGLISRSAIAALSFLAAGRVVLVGDSKQLAPISQISRVLPTRQQTWLASSGLSHLEEIEETPKAVHVLSEQHRMHPDVCKVVSDYQYNGFLTTAKETAQRESNLSPFLANYSRAIWYVLDEEDVDLEMIRADRGPGNKSWVRSVTSQILKKLFADDGVRQARGLFISPFKAQAQAISKLFTKEGLVNWESSTVHSQQGSEADIVIFDTVSAGSHSWHYNEWKRLVNVALSRAREAVIVLASRSEMEEPYLKPLVSKLTPSVLINDNNRFHWKKVDLSQKHFRRKQNEEELTAKNLGSQFDQRKQMTPVLSQEQQRLTNLTLDGKPRLVRGVAGSGKSIVLCNWLAKTVYRLDEKENVRIWAVYANRSLHKLLQQSIESAWEDLTRDDLFEEKEFPWKNVDLLHVKDVLEKLLPSASLSMKTFEFDYDRAAEEFLNRQDIAEIIPRCTALFIDEAQDMGPSTLKLLLSLVAQSDPEDPNSRSAHIFYDNAQNIYDRKTPTWTEYGIDMRGRSTIMKESFRSTTPITELAVNLLHRLSPTRNRQDQKELLSLGLIEQTKRNGEEWFNVRFNQVDGPNPIFNLYDNREAEFDAIAIHLTHLIKKEHVSPIDICLIYNGKSVLQQIETKLKPRMKDIGVELSVQKSSSFERKPNTLIVTTPNSYKGYESEVVIIPCADQFISGKREILANSLYVAITRARSLLAIYSQKSNSPLSRKLNETITSCIDNLNWTPPIEAITSIQDDQNDILDQIGQEHRKWLIKLWQQFEIRQEPITDNSGSIIVEPLFWFATGNKTYACFNNELFTAEIVCKLVDAGVAVLKIGKIVGIKKENE